MLNTHTMLLQVELNRAAMSESRKCNFTANVAMGLDCQRGQLQDVCWSLSAQDTDHEVDKSGCVGPIKREQCAQSNFTVYVFETLGGTPPQVGGGVLARGWRVMLRVMSRVRL